MTISISGIRKDFINNLLKYKAIMILLYSLSYEEFKAINKTIENINEFSRETIRSKHKILTKHLYKLSKEYGIDLTSDKLVEFIQPEQSEEEPSMNRLRYILKYLIDEVFKSYNKIWKGYDNYPPHARIGINIHNPQNHVEIFLLEASLYEDMAIFWNLTYDFDELITNTAGIESFKLKQYMAYIRATAKSAFNFLEGYLNGLALDTFLFRSVADKTMFKLLEFDFEKNKKVFLKLRDKILQYPKIALNREHPPLNEGNCEEISKILEYENLIRHSLIHPTPRFDPISYTYDRENEYMNLSFLQLTDLCDSIISLVIKINEATNFMYGRVEHWLFKRSKGGKFPKESFK